MKLKLLFLAVVFIATASYQYSSFATEPSEASHVVIENIECRGNKSVSCEFIRKKLHLSLNTQVIDAEVQTARLRLSALPNFKSVDVKLEKGSEKGKAILIVEVVEASSLLTEVVLGVTNASYGAPNSGVDFSGLTGTLSGRVSYQNLFDRQKIIELTVLGAHTQASPDALSQTSNVVLTYIDPNLFGSDRIFMSLDASYLQQRDHGQQTFRYDSISADPTPLTLTDRYDYTQELTGADALIGYRLWSYSYVFVRYIYESIHNKLQDQVTDNPTGVLNVFLISDDKRYGKAWSFGYGWDSEDDPHFPTQGSVLSALVYEYTFATDCAYCDHNSWQIAYKKNWLVGGHSVLTLNVGGDPAGIGDRVRPIEPEHNDGLAGLPAALLASSDSGTLGLRYAYLMNDNNGEGNTRRSRWYVQLETGPVVISNHERIGGYPTLAALTIGIRFESKILGVVDLYATGSRYWLR